MEKTDQETAREMFKHEHTRWNQNSLLFLGIIGAILLSFEHLKDVVPLKWIFLISALISFFWLCAVIANRRSTFVWLETIKELEANPGEVKIFTRFDELSKGFDHFKDFFSNFAITPANGSDKRRFALLGAVSRIYVAVSLLFIIAFSLLSYLEFTKDSPSQDVLDSLGRKVLNTEVIKLYPDAKIVEAYGPFKLNGESVIQVRVVRTTGQQFFLNWRLDSLGHVSTTNDSTNKP